MKIADNSVKTITTFIEKELKSNYAKQEVQSIVGLLLEAYTGLSRIDIISGAEQRITESQILKLLKAAKRLKKNEPVQYVLGHCTFDELKIKVNAHVLIPRQETEELVHLIINSEKHASELSILDIGTGSGCIALALKHHLPHAEVKGADVSQKALEVAKANAIANNLNVGFIQMDILATHKNPTSKHNVIVSNPPYVRESETKHMGKNVLDYEPHMALFVKNANPLLFYKAIITFADKHLTESGRVYFEINENLKEEIEVLLKQSGYKNIESKKDINGKYRMVKAVRT